MEPWKAESLRLISRTLRLFEFVYSREIPGVIQRLHSLSLYTANNHQEFAAGESEALEKILIQLKERYKASTEGK